MAIRFLEMQQTGRWLQVRREIDMPDGTVKEDVHAFPIEALAFRAGEYGIPVTDTETLLDLVTAESLPDFHPEGTVAPFVVTESTPAAGRARHLARARELLGEHAKRAPKGNGTQVRAAGTRHADVRAAIVAASDLDPELAELAGRDLERQLPRARELHGRRVAAERAVARVQEAANGDGTSTLKTALRRRLERAETIRAPGRH